jgi:hypothetical protein
MKKYFWAGVIALMFLFPFAAGGEEWVMVFEAGNFHVDVNSITQVAPNQYEAWYKAELKNDVYLKPINKLSLFDCAEKKLKPFKLLNISGTVKLTEQAKRTGNALLLILPRQRSYILSVHTEKVFCISRTKKVTSTGLTLNNMG